MNNMTRQIAAEIENWTNHLLVAMWKAARSDAQRIVSEGDEFSRGMLAGSIEMLRIFGEDVDGIDEDIEAGKSGEHILNIVNIAAAKSAS